MSYKILDNRDIDLSYNPESENPQSGKAIAQAIEAKPGEITITGADYGQSAYASVRGERFNDYDDTNGNRALAAGSHAEGIRSIEYDGLKQTVIQNIAGCGCFEIDSKSVLGSYYYYPNFNTTNKTIIVKGDASAYATGDVISVITDTNFDECATIASVSYNGSDKTTITLQEWPEGLKQGSSNILFDSDNVVKSYVPMTLRVVAKPLVGTTYLGLGAHTEGVGSRALADGAHAEGRETKAMGRYSHTEGRETKAHYAAHAEGWKSQAIGNHAHAEGEATKAFGYNAHAEGDSSTASGKTSHAEGYNTKAEGSMSHAEGNKTQATGYASHAEGDSNIASNNGAHAEGYNTKAISQMAHAEGRGTVAGFVQEDGTIAGTAAHAEGNNTGALAYCAHAEGNETIASAQYAHAEGLKTKAQGNSAHAEGSYTIASGEGSHAEGDHTTASGIRSHAEGFYTKALHLSSHAGGGYTETGRNYQTVIGEYNIVDSEALFIVANGIYVGDSSIDEQKNAFVVKEDGSAILQTQGEADNAVVINSTLNAKAAEIIEQLHGTGISREVVEILPTIEEANDYTIYMVSNNSSSEDNIYDEYLLINNNWEMIGSTEVDLTNYYIKSEVDNKISAKPGTKTAQGGEIFNDVANIASGSLSHAEGHTTQALAYAAHAEGDQTQAQKSSAHAEGYKTIAMSEASHAEGESTQAIGSDSHAEGRKTKAGKVQADGTVMGTTAHAEGNWTTAEAYASHAEGSETLASAQYAHAEGLKSKAQGDAAHAEGINTTAEGYGSHAEGKWTMASGNYSHVEGHETAAYNSASHAEGRLSKAYGESSHVEGENTQTGRDSSNFPYGAAAHAEGYNTKALSNYSHAEGEDTCAGDDEPEGIKYSKCAHAEGYGTAARGMASHAEGYQAIAVGEASHAGGYGTYAPRKAQTVIGKFNTYETDTLFIVGNGTSDSNADRSNAFEVYEDGHAEVQTMGESNNSVATKEYVDSAINALEAKKTVSVSLTKGDTGNYNINYDEVNSATKFTARVQFHAHSEYLFDVPLTFGQCSDGKTFVLSGMVYLNSIDSASGSNPGFNGFNLYCTYPTDDLNLCNIGLYSDHAVTVYSISY